MTTNLYRIDSIEGYSQIKTTYFYVTAPDILTALAIAEKNTVKGINGIACISTECYLDDRKSDLQDTKNAYYKDGETKDI